MESYEITSNCFMRGAHEIPGIVVNDLDSRVFQNIIILFAGSSSAIACGIERLDLTYDDPLDTGIQRERARRDSGAKSDDQNRARCSRCISAGNVAQHTLHLHVPRFGRGFDLAADVKISRACRDDSVTATEAFTPSAE